MVALAVFLAGPAAADDGLTLDKIVELARTGAYESRFAALDVEDARARLAGAQILIRENPSISASAGPRLGDPVTIDGSATIGVPIEIGVRRGRAIDFAESELRRDQYRLAAVQRRAILDALAVYLRVLHATEQLGLAAERRTIAEQLVETAQQREQAGDASRFEVNLARAELARSSSQVLEAERHVLVSRAELARALALPVELMPAVKGALAEVSSAARLRTALGAVELPELDEAAAETRAADAAVVLAETAWWPDVSLQGNYALDDGEQITTAGVSFTLPLFANGQQERRAAAVRVERSRLSAAATSARLALERQRANIALRAATDAAQVLAEDAVPRAVENESLAREAYRAGKLDLASYVVLRRDSLETRQEHLDRLLEKGLAAIVVAALGSVPEQSEKSEDPERP